LTQSANLFSKKLSNYKEGDYVVHRDNGIGKFLGLKKISITNCSKEFIALEYLNADKLYVPVENIDLVSKYSNKNSSVKLDKLGSKSWNSRKKKVRRKIKKAAAQLIQIAALRAQKKSQVLEACPVAYKKFCEGFPFIETRDQLDAINDVLKDLKNSMPMDRLVCGDVSFGKTEVALRAASVSVLGKNRMQVAIIVPSTLLAIQHEKLFQERFLGFSVKIKTFSRLSSTSELKKIKEKLKLGEIDIVIGTHALFAKDVAFYNLGLLIIDEEHHFGVFQKEQLKNLNNNVHVLSLSATPIPRTLHLSLSGIKELSIIATPPTKRKPIITSVSYFDTTIVKNAILKEIERGGKIMIVTPRIQYISVINSFVKKHIADAKCVLLHGNLSPEKIKASIESFKNGNCNILICTHIVDSGLDIPRVDTIIIDRANLFGLSQLYQIRGRVGRGYVQAYAYITYQPNARLNKEAEMRLNVMQNIGSLGDGLSIAEADMEIRGYGNLLGEEQTGHIKDIGIELYQKMLAQEIDLAKNANFSIEEEEFIPDINLCTQALIPAQYIQDSHERLFFYKRFADAHNQEETDTIQKELSDRFGVLPEEIKNLILTIKIKKLAKKVHVEKIISIYGGYNIKFYKNTPKNIKKVVELIKLGQLNLSFAQNQVFFIKINAESTYQKLIKLSEILKLFR
jgi:transcription-repair coupling factor (superfamily II helicase)